MADLLDFQPIFQETPESIRARMDADANAGVSPSEDAYVDLTEGGVYYDLSQAALIEIDRQWDALGNEIVAAMFPTFAWGEYLDEHGVAPNVIRNAAAKATGSVTFTGTNGTVVNTGTEVSTPQTDPDSDPIVFETTAGGTIAGGTLTLPIIAKEDGVLGNVAALAITLLNTPIEGIATVSNAAPTSGGADVETDEAFLSRLKQRYGSPKGAGNAADYEAWARENPSVGFATVEPLWNGAGTVRVVVTDPANNPVSGTIVSDLQTTLDPVPGQGQGRAPVGAHVTVATPTLLLADIAATVVLRTGYSLSGAGGAVALEDAIEEAIRSYVDALPPGGDVIRENVIAAVFGVTGVYDVTALTINGAATNLAVSSLQIARADDVVVT